jgi:two-component system sensor histidine kinase MprB
VSGRVTLAARVTWLTAVAVGVAVAVASLAAFVTVRSQTLSTLDQNLLDRARSVSATLDDPGFLSGVPPSAMVAADIRIALLDGTGQAVCACTEATRPPLSGAELAVARGDAPWSLRTVNIDGESLRVAAVPVPNLEGGFALVVAQSLEPTERTLRRLGLVLLLVGGLGVLVAALAGWAVARSALRPVRRLTEAAEDVARTARLEPIEVTGDDEIARLSMAFNSMLAAVAASQARQRRLVADAGHELRTPLTSLRTNLDLLAQADQQGGLPAQARTELLADVRAQIEELSTLVGDLVELARDEPLHRDDESIDMAEIVSRAVERVRRRAGSVRFEVSLQPWFVRGEPQALERAVTNLLDNAVKWSPPGGTVRVHLVDGGLIVGDDGPGIADEDLPLVFDRFYRSPEARMLPGSGLGLAIVRQAAERHGGHVAVGHSASGGAELWLGIPGSSTPDHDPVGHPSEGGAQPG